MTTDTFLLEHGTKPWRLPASAVLHTAKADIQLRDRKRKNSQASRDLSLPGSEHYDYELQHRSYAFINGHVRSAADAADLLRRAIDDDNDWHVSTKVNTKILYGDKDLLRAALTLFETRVAA